MRRRPRRRPRFSLVEANRLRNTISQQQTFDALDVSRGDAIQSRTVCTVLHSITRTFPQVDLLSRVTTSNVPCLVVVPYCHRGKLEIALVTGQDDHQNRNIEVVVVSGAASARYRTHRWLKRILVRKLRGKLQRQFTVLNVEVAAASRLCKTSRDTLFVACSLAQRLGSVQHPILHQSVRLELPSYFEMCRMRALLVSYTNADTVYVFDTRTNTTLQIRCFCCKNSEIYRHWNLPQGTRKSVAFMRDRFLFQPRGNHMMKDASSMNSVIPRPVRGAAYCTQCRRLLNRDENAAMNIAYVLVKYVRHGVLRPPHLSRN